MKQLHNAKTVIIKIGSTTLFNAETNMLHYRWFSGLIEDIAALRGQGKNVAIVTSGAVAFGRNILGIMDRPLRLEEKQAAAACGQLELIKQFQAELEKYHLNSAQILITLEDSNDRRRYLNAKNTLLTLLSHHIIPIINENDTITTDEIRFGDNDRLSARVAEMIDGDCLVLLSDIDGLYTANPSQDPTAKFISEVPQITDEIRGYASGSSSRFGTGGMMTKIRAAEMATASGCHTYIALGMQDRPITAILNGGKHTLFVAHDTPQNARKAWIANQINTTGKIIVDDGAINALNRGTSLLPAGITAIEGNFMRGDAVTILSKDGKEIARGLVSYNAAEAKLIIGKQNSEIEDILGDSQRDNFIHRDNMALLISH